MSLRRVGVARSVIAPARVGVPQNPRYYTLFNAGPGVVAATADDLSVNTATEFYTVSPARLTAIRYWQATTDYNLGVRKFGLWDVTAAAFVALLPDVTPVAGDAGKWVTSTLVNPYSLIVNRRYKAIVLHPAGRYTTTSFYFNTGPGASGLVNGPLRAPELAAATTPGQGTFEYNAALVNTANFFNSGCYWVDVVVIV